MLPGVETAVYEVITDPPLLAGAVKETVAVLDPVAVAVPIVGAPGIDAAETPAKFSIMPLILNYL
jgi:hypothetical protein